METVPEAAAWIGVPLGTPMSMPGWQLSQARASQNAEVIGPLTGQIIPEELSPWTGPAGAVVVPEGAGAAGGGAAAAASASACCFAWSWAAICAEMSLTSPSS